jgi:hypothetical protein
MAEAFEGWAIVEGGAANRSVRGASPHQPTTCDSCHAPIWFAITTAGHKSMPLNASTDPKGNTACYQDDVGTWHARVLRKGQQPGSHEKLFCPHFATCPKAAEHRKQVREAQAELHTRQRRHVTRGRRGTPAIPDQPGLFRYPGASA